MLIHPTWIRKYSDLMNHAKFTPGVYSYRHMVHTPGVCSYRHMVQIRVMETNDYGCEVSREGDSDKAFLINRVDIPKMSL